MLRRLGGIGAPAVVMQLVTLMFMNLGPININLDACEYFAGEQAVPIQQHKCHWLLYSQKWVWDALHSKSKPFLNQIQGLKPVFGLEPSLSLNPPHSRDLFRYVLVDPSRLHMRWHQHGLAMDIGLLHLKSDWLHWWTFCQFQGSLVRCHISLNHFYHWSIENPGSWNGDTVTSFMGVFRYLQLRVL